MVSLTEWFSRRLLTPNHPLRRCGSIVMASQRKFLVLLMTTLMLAASLAGCLGGDESDSESETDTGTENSTDTGTAATEGDQTVWMLSYVYGPVTASASASDYDVGTSTNDQELSSYAISYTISDELSVTYGTEDIEVGGAVSDAEYESISASYTAGGMTITAAMKEGENVANGTASNQDFEYWSLGASFAF